MAAFLAVLGQGTRPEELVVVLLAVLQLELVVVHLVQRLLHHRFALAHARLHGLHLRQVLGPALALLEAQLEIAQLLPQGVELIVQRLLGRLARRLQLSGLLEVRAAQVRHVVLRLALQLCLPLREPPV